jgi:Helix-turn-helix domain
MTAPKVTVLQKWKLALAIAAQYGVASETLVGMRLLDHYNAKFGRCDPSFATIARAIGIDRRTVIRAVQTLIADGWITKRTRGGGNGGAHVSNSFDFIWDRAGDSSATTGDSDDTSRVSSESLGGASGDTPPSDFGDRPPGDSGDTQNYGIDSNSEILNDEVSAGSKQSCVSDHRDDTHHHGPSGLDSFERWWQNYPLRVAKDDALREYNKIIVAGRASHDDLLRGAMRYGAVCAGKDPRYFPYPANWLKGGRWSDEPEPQHEQANSDAAVEAILSTAHRTRSAS